MTREEFISQMGYRDDSPLRNEDSLDIKTGDNGVIDMTNTGTPLMANGRYLPPYSGYHQFEPNSTVTEIPIGKQGEQLPNKGKLSNEDSWRELYYQWTETKSNTTNDITYGDFIKLPDERKIEIMLPSVLQQPIADASPDRTPGQRRFFSMLLSMVKHIPKLTPFVTTMLSPLEAGKGSTLSKQFLDDSIKPLEWDMQEQLERDVMNPTTFRTGGQLPKFQNKGEWTDEQMRIWQTVQYNMRKDVPEGGERVEDRTTWPKEYKLGWWEDAKVLYDWWPDTSTKKGRSKAYSLHRATLEAYPEDIAGYYFAPGHNNEGKIYPYGAVSKSEDIQFKVDHDYFATNKPESLTEWMNEEVVESSVYDYDMNDGDGGYPLVPKSRWSDEISLDVWQHLQNNEEAAAEALPYIKFRFQKKQDALDYLQEYGYGFWHPISYYDENQFDPNLRGIEKKLIIPSQLSSEEDVSMNDVVYDENYLKYLEHMESMYRGNNLKVYEEKAKLLDNGKTGFELFLNDSPGLLTKENPTGQLISKWKVVESEEEANLAVRYAGDLATSGFFNQKGKPSFNFTDSTGNVSLIENPHYIAPPPIATGQANSVPFFAALFMAPITATAVSSIPVTAAATRLWQPFKYVGGLSIPGTSIPVSTGVNAYFAYDFGTSAKKHFEEGETGWGALNAVGALWSLNGAYRGYQSTVKLFPDGVTKIKSFLGLTSKTNNTITNISQVSKLSSKYKWGEMANGINNNVKPFSFRNLFLSPTSKYRQTTQLSIMDKINKVNESTGSLYQPLKIERGKGILSFLPRSLNTRQPWTLNNKIYYTPDKLTNISYNRLPGQISDYSKVVPLKTKFNNVLTNWREGSKFFTGINKGFNPNPIGIQPYNLNIKGINLPNSKYSLFDDAGNAIINKKGPLFNRQPFSTNDYLNKSFFPNVTNPIGEYVPFQNIKFNEGGQLPEYQVKGEKVIKTILEAPSLIRKGANLFTKGYESLFGLNKTSSLYQPLQLTKIGDWNHDLNFKDWSNNLKGYFPYPTEKHIMYEGIPNMDIGTIKTVANNPLQLRSLLSNKYQTEVGTQSPLLKSTNKFGEIRGQSILDLINNKNTSILDKSILEKTYTGLSLTPKSKISLNMFKENVSNNIIQFQPVLTDEYAMQGMDELGFKKPTIYNHANGYATEKSTGPFDGVIQNQTILWKDAKQYKENQIFTSSSGDMNSPRFGDLISPDEQHFNPTQYGNVFGFSRFFVDLENKKNITIIESQSDESSGYHKVMEVVDREKRALLEGIKQFEGRDDFAEKFPILLNKIKTSEHAMITDYTNLPTLGVDKKKAQWLRLFNKATPESNKEELEAIAKGINEFKYGEYDKIPKGKDFGGPEILGPWHKIPSDNTGRANLYSYGMRTNSLSFLDEHTGEIKRTWDNFEIEEKWRIGINGHLGDSPTYTELIKWRDENMVMWDIQKNITQKADKLYLQFLKNNNISNELSAEQLGINLQRKATVQAEQLRLVSDELAYAGSNGFTTYRRATPETAAKVEHFNNQLEIPNIDLRDYIENPWTHINVAEFKSNVINLFNSNSYGHTKIAKKYGPFVVIPENANKFILNSDKGTQTEMSAQSLGTTSNRVDRWVNQEDYVSGDDYYAAWSEDFITTHHETYGQIPDDFITNQVSSMPTYKIKVREKEYKTGGFEQTTAAAHTWQTNLNDIDIPENIVNNIKPGMYRINDDGSWTYYDEIGSDLRYYTNMIEGIEEIALGVRSEYHIPKPNRPPFDISLYDKEQQTILRKYSTFPKDIAVILGKDYPVRTVVDNKGNTWWEIDVPVDFQIGKGERPGMRHGGELPKAQFGGALFNPPNLQEDNNIYVDNEGNDLEKTTINGKSYYIYTIQKGDSKSKVSDKFGLWNESQILDNINGQFYKSDKEGGYKGVDYAKNNNRFWAGDNILVGGPEFEKHVKYNNDRNAYVNSFQDISDPYLMSMITAIGETETGSKVNYVIPKDRKYITDVDMDTSGQAIPGGLWDQDHNPYTGTVGTNDKAYAFKSASRDPALGRFGIKGNLLNQYAIDILGYKEGDDFTKKYLKSKDDQQKLMKYLITDVYPEELSKLRHFNAKNASQYSDFQLLAALHRAGYTTVNKQLEEGEFSRESTSGDISVGGYIDKADRYLNPKLDISNNQYFIPQNSYHLPYNTIPGYKKFGGSIGKLEIPMKNKVIGDMINNGAFLPMFKEGSEMNLKGILGDYNIKKGYDNSYELPYIEYTMPDEKLKDNKIYYDKDDVDGTNDFNIIDIVSQRQEQEREHLRVKAIIKKYNNGENLSHTEQKHMEELGLLDSSPTLKEIEEKPENKHPGSDLSIVDIDIKKDLVNKTDGNSYGTSLNNQISLYLKHVNSSYNINEDSDKISKLYNKLNTVYYNDAKAHKMTVIDYMKSLNN